MNPMDICPDTRCPLCGTPEETQATCPTKGETLPTLMTEERRLNTRTVTIKGVQMTGVIRAIMDDWKPRTKVARIELQLLSGDSMVMATAYVPGVRGRRACAEWLESNTSAEVL